MTETWKQGVICHVHLLDSHSAVQLKPKTPTAKQTLAVRSTFEIDSVISIDLFFSLKKTKPEMGVCAT